MISTSRVKMPALALSVGLAAAALSACGSEQVTDASGEECADIYTVAFSHPVGEAEAVKAVKKFVEERASEVGCVEVLLDNTTGSNLESQRAAVEGWVTQNVDAIVVWPVDSSALTGLQEQAQSSGTKWLTYAQPMDGQDGSVGFDNDLSGEQIAEDLEAWLVENYPDGYDGISAAVTSLSALPALSGRWEIPIAKLEELAIPIVYSGDCADQSCGLQIGEDTLRENPDLRIFIGINDDAALGAMKAFEDAGIDPATTYFAGQDGGSQSLAAIEAGGHYKASAAILLDHLGHSIVDNSIAAITGEGETDNLSPSEIASLADLERLQELQGLFEGLE